MDLTISQRAKEIFLVLADHIPAEEWEKHLDEMCAGNSALQQRARALLHAHADPKSYLDQPAIDLTLDTDKSRETAESPGMVIGPYKLLQQIGEGGMGVVWMAEQTQPVQRKVALKVIKPGMDSRQVIARFETERQALALMDHVNIARVLDAGTTESGLPFFVMELVHGVPITQFCDDSHLTPRERLELFVPVCQAIQHAHQKGIIHRDIKPSNVMVTLYDGKPVPKVIDFGVAKATEQKLTERTLFTQYGTMVGTLEYMSPEQAEMSALGVDTRSDIYSLGALLYELLTGSTPLTHKRMKEAAYAEVLRLIKEEEPPRPSTRLSDSGEALASISAQRHMEPAKLTKLVRGELDWIVMKTLEKERNRRYETANAFAADLLHYLQDEPVQACPPSATYRFGKFTRRNRVIITTATLVAAALLLGTIVSTWQAIRATQASHEADAARESEATLRKQAEADEKKAEREAIKSQQVASFLAGMFDGPTPWTARGRDITLLRVIVDRAASRIDTDLKDQPAVDAELRNIIGFTYWSINEFAKAEAMHRQAIAICRRIYGNENLPLANSLVRLALPLRDTAKRRDAEAALREALAIQTKLLGKDHPDIAHTLRDLGLVVLSLNRRDEAIDLERQALAMRRRLYASDHPDVADSLNRLVSVLPGEQNEEAEALAREAVAMQRRLAKNAPSSGLGVTLRHLAIILQHEGRLPEAEAAARESLDNIWRTTGDSTYTMDSYFRVAVILEREGKDKELEVVFNEYPIPTIGRQHYRADLLETKADILRRQGRSADADELHRQAVSLGGAGKDPDSNRRDKAPQRLQDKASKTPGIVEPKPSAQQQTPQPEPKIPNSDR
jgi:serine/threonine protein kinase